MFIGARFRQASLRSNGTLSKKKGNLKKEELQLQKPEKTKDGKLTDAETSQIGSVSSNAKNFNVIVMVLFFICFLKMERDNSTSFFCWRVAVPTFSNASNINYLCSSSSHLMVLEWALFHLSVFLFFFLNHQMTGTDVQFYI